MSQPGDSRQMLMAAFSAGNQLSPFSTAPLPSQPMPRPTAPAAATAAPSSQQTSPIKDLSPATMCRMGQELVQEISTKTVEIFSLYGRAVQQLVTGSNVDRKAKFEEYNRRIEALFQKLRKVYDAVNEMSANAEPRPTEDLLPIIEIDGNEEVFLQPEPTKSTSEEEQELIEQIRAKNHYLKQIIDHQRIIVWEINTMLAMRKTMP